MKVAIMQPYLFPYIGYFQLIQAVDEFIIYDNIQYSKKGWVNRNRILVNGKDAYLTLSLKKDSDYLNIKDRVLADNWNLERKKIVNGIRAAYSKAPCFPKVFPLLEEILNHQNQNLFEFILNSIKQINQYLEIATPLIISSSIQINHDLKSQNKVLALCKARHATTYINPIGGIDLYDKDVFNSEGLQLQFLKADNIIYPQFQNDFIPFLSIIDVMMFNTRDELLKALTSFTLN